MFGRDAGDRKNENGSAPRDRTKSGLEAERRLAAWIGSSVVIRGRVSSSEDMTIAGRVEGDIDVRENVLVIAPEARIEGNVTALAVVVNGRVTGDVEAQRNIEIGATGAVFGDIVTPRMSIAEGATLEGTLSIMPIDGQDPGRQPRT